MYASYQCVAAREDDLDVHGQGPGRHEGARVRDREQRRRGETCDTPESERVGCERASLVDADDVDLASNGNFERLGTENVHAGEREERVGDGEGELHGQLGRYDRCDYHDAVQEEFVATARRVTRALGSLSLELRMKKCTSSRT